MMVREKRGKITRKKKKKRMWNSTRLNGPTLDRFLVVIVQNVQVNVLIEPKDTYIVNRPDLGRRASKGSSW